MSYEVFIEKLAQRVLEKISQPNQNRIIDGIRNLGTDPRPPGVRKLAGRPAWRIRVGAYRIIYEIDDEKSTILVVALGHRKEVYKSGR